MGQSRKFDVVVMGGANTDYLVTTEVLPKPGETRVGRCFQCAPGGKGANQAVAAARLGARTAFVGKVGRDERGKELIAVLRKEGVNVDFISFDRKESSGVALIMVEEGGEKLILAAPGANLSFSLSDLRRARRLIERSRVLLLQFELPMPVVREAARMGREAGAEVILDPAPPAPAPASLLKLIGIVRPNESEAEALTGLKVSGRASARAAALRLIEMGAGAAAVQAGDAGNLLVWPGGETFLPKLRVRSVDATGAGDAFAAGLAVARAEGRTLREAGAFANAAAALATTKIGAQAALPRRAAVWRLMRNSHFLLVANK